MLIDHALRSQLEKMANHFISGVLQALRSRPLTDLANGSQPKTSRTVAPGPPHSRSALTSGRTASREPGSNGGRRKRASPAEVQQQKQLALTTAKTLGSGFSKGDVMKKSGSPVDLGRALSLLVAQGKLTKKGDRRNTRYSVR